MNFALKVTIFQQYRYVVALIGEALDKLVYLLYCKASIEMSWSISPLGIVTTPSLKV